MAKVLKDTIQKIEETPVEGLSRFVNKDLKAVFGTSLLHLQDALRLNDGSVEDTKLSKLSISVGLLALEVQIKVRNVYSSSLKQPIPDKLLLDTSLDVENLIRNLLKTPKAGAASKLNEYRGASAQPSLNEPDCAANQMIRLYIASRVTIAYQASSILSIDKIIAFIEDRETIFEEMLNPFLALVMVEQNNSLSYLLQEKLAAG